MENMGFLLTGGLSIRRMLQFSVSSGDKTQGMGNNIDKIEYENKVSDR